MLKKLLGECQRLYFTHMGRRPQ